MLAAPRSVGSLPRRISIGRGTTLAFLAVIAFSDLLIWRLMAPYGVEALLDESAHAATGLLALAALGLQFRTSVVLAVLAGSLLIDLDHIPHAFGSHVLEHGIPRPYTHSLGTLIVVFVIALILSDGAHRRLAVVGALALALHFFRDLAEPGSAGVALLWPLSNHAFAVGYGWFAALVVILATIALARRRTGHRT